MPTAATIGVGVLGALSSSKASKRAAKSQEAGQAAALAAAEKATREARESAIPLFQSAQQNALAGFGGALDLFNQVTPQQIQAFQQGNVGAQQTLLSGQQQAQNAILGGNVNLQGALQPQQINIDPSLFNTQLPEFTSINDALSIGQQPVLNNRQQTFRNNFLNTVPRQFRPAGDALFTGNNPFRGDNPIPNANLLGGG